MSSKCDIAPCSAIACVAYGGCVLALMLVGCVKDPFAAATFTDAETRQHLRRIDPIQLDDYQRSDDTDNALVQPPPADLSITLEQCRAWTLENNLDLRVAVLDPTIADQRVTEEEARFESLFFAGVNYNDTLSPTASTLEGSETNRVNTNLGVRIPTRAGGSVTIDFAGGRYETDNVFSTLNPSFTSDVGVSISQNLLRNAGMRVNAAPIQIARLSAQSSYARTKLEVIRALATVDRLYWRLYAAQQELQVRQAQHELAMAQLEAARRLVEQGNAAEIEIIRAESGVAEGLEAIIVAENRVRQRQRELKRLLNAPQLPMGGPTRLIPDTPVNPVAYDLSAEALLVDAMAGRLELLELELALARDALNVEVARNATLPLALLEYRYTRNGLGDDFGDAFKQDINENFDSHTVGLRVEVPLGNQAARSALRRALLMRLQRLATREQREAQIRQEVLDALDTLEAAWQRVLASRQAAILADRVLAAEQRQFDQGLNTSTDVQDARTRLADAQSKQVQALVDYQIAQIDVAFATGVILGSTRVRWEPAAAP